jgi:hypothetical protein
MAEIVLITPPVTLKERYGQLSKAANTLPSLGILYLAAVLRKEGYILAFGSWLMISCLDRIKL